MKAGLEQKKEELEAAEPRLWTKIYSLVMMVFSVPGLGLCARYIIVDPASSIWAAHLFLPLAISSIAAASFGFLKSETCWDVTKVLVCASAALFFFFASTGAMRMAIVGHIWPTMAFATLFLLSLPILILGYRDWREMRTLSPQGKLQNAHTHALKQRTKNLAARHAAVAKQKQKKQIAQKEKAAKTLKYLNKAHKKGAKVPANALRPKAAPRIILEAGAQVRRTEAAEQQASRATSRGVCNTQ